MKAARTITVSFTIFFFISMRRLRLVVWGVRFVGLLASDCETFLTERAVSLCASVKKGNQTLKWSLGENSCIFARRKASQLMRPIAVLIGSQSSTVIEAILGLAKIVVAYEVRSFHIRLCMRAKSLHSLRQ